MQSHGTLGNCQSQTYTSSFAIARFIDAIKWTKDFIENLSRDARSVIAHDDDGEFVICFTGRLGGF